MPIVSNFPTGGGNASGIALAPVSIVDTMTSSGKVYVKWIEPDDIVVDGIQLAAWSGTILVRKAGSAPISRRDGTIVLDCTERNAYMSEYFIDSGLTDGVTYYYKFFPYTKDSVFTDSEENVFSATPEKIPTDDVSGVSIEDGLNGRVLLKWADPAETVVKNGMVVTRWASTKVVYKTDGYPTSPEDGTLVLNSVTRNAYAASPLTVDGLSNGETYYFGIFPVAADGAVNTNTASAVSGMPNHIKLTSVPSQVGELVYTGEALTPVWSEYDTENISVGGDTTATDAGTYTATFTPGYDYCWPDGSTNPIDVRWVIEKASIDVPTVTGSLVYTGSAQSPVWAGYDSMKMTIGGDASGTDAGTYTTIFTPEKNYQWGESDDGAKEVEWSITRAVISIPTASALTYNREEQSPVWVGYDQTKMRISDQISGTDAGSYTASFTPLSNYQWSDGSIEAANVIWKIEKAPGSLSVTPASIALHTDAPSGTFEVDRAGDGNITARSSNTDIIKVSVSGTTVTVEGVNNTAGSATITVEVSEGKNYLEPTDKTVAVSYTVRLQAVPSQSGELTYTGSPQSPSWSDYNSAQLEIGGTTSGTDATSYTASFTPKQYYAWDDGSTITKNVSWTIGKQSISTVPSQSGSLTYNNSTQSPTWSNYNSSQLTISGDVSGKDADTYTARFAPTSNYRWSDDDEYKTATWTIGRATITTVPSQSGKLTYTGEPQTPTWNDYDSSKMSLSVTAQTNAGTYSASFTPTSNYIWSGGSDEAKSASWTIGKAAGSLTLSKSSITLNSSTKSATFTVTRAGDGLISVKSSDTSVASVSLSGTTVTVSSVNDKTGTATITVEVAEGTNHLKPADKTCSVSCEFLPAVGTALNSCSWEDVSKIAASGLASTYWSVGATKKITINGTVGTLSLSNLSVDVFILGFDHNSTYEGSKIIHFQIGKINSTLIGLVCSTYGSYKTDGTKCFNMNHWGDYNYGGWKGSDIRYDILGSTNIAPSGYGSAVTTSRTGYDATSTCATSPVSGTLMAALPSDLRAVMKGVKKYSDNTGNSSNVAANVTATVDYLPLLAEFEVQGARSYANQYEQNYQKQYTYYANGNSKVMYRHNATSSTVWWRLRSARYSGSNYFCLVNTGGSAGNYNARSAGALAPGFFV